MCESIFPEDILNVGKQFLFVETNGVCIEPGQPETGLEVARDRLTKLSFPESVKTDLLFSCHSCTWWFWWHIFLIVLGLLVLIGIIGFIKLCICNKQKRVQVSKANNEADHEMES